MAISGKSAKALTRRTTFSIISTASGMSATYMGKPLFCGVHRHFFAEDRSMLPKIFACWVIATLLAFPAMAQARRTLDIYFIDVEGGQATLIVTPQGQSLLIDTGFPGFDGRDANRIVAAAKAAALTRIDYVLITHYHRDHVGGLGQLVNRIPVGTFIDHGKNQEDTEAVKEYYKAYQDVAARAKHIVLRPGDSL